MKSKRVVDAFQALEHNFRYATENPEKMQELNDELLYANFNNYDEIKELYEYYGLKYCMLFWESKQLDFWIANYKTEQRLKEQEK